jgi:hypothetical protein
MKRAIAIVSLLCAACLCGAWTARTTIPAALVATQSATPTTWESAGLTNGLVAYWAMRTNTANNVVTDEYGTNAATAVNGVLFGSAYGKRDDGAGFDGANDFINVPVTASVRASTAASISFWFQSPSAVSANYCIFGESTSTAGNNRFSIFYLTDRTFQVVIRDTPVDPTGSAKSWVTANSISASNYTHIAVTTDSAADRVSLYVNGVVDYTSTGTAFVEFKDTAPALIRIAVQPVTTVASPYKGNLDEVAIWNRALSSNEVYQLYSTPLYAPYK